MQVPVLGHSLPLISPRMEFHLPSPGRLPHITPRLSYNSLQEIVASRTNQDRRIAQPTSMVLLPHAVFVPKNEEKEEFHPPTPNSLMTYKYKKPQGQPGRPNSGGYNLENVLLEQCNWSREFFQRIQHASQKQVQCLAEKNLVTKQSFQTQDFKSVKKLCREAGSSFQCNTENNWAFQGIRGLLADHSDAETLLEGKVRGLPKREHAQPAQATASVYLSTCPRPSDELRTSGR
ncbi:hypothetical protein C8R46DRAFT_1042108 [Mycena filopes]|nr:hypothetical protein C8R46DRAFT_1042108 [Mycena filopes]